MGAAASVGGLGAVHDQEITVEDAGRLIGPSFDAAKLEQKEGKVSTAQLFAVYGVELPFGDATTCVMFDSDKSRGRCFVELKDTIRNYSGVFRVLYDKFAVADPTKGLTKAEFSQMMVQCGNEDLDDAMAEGVYEEVTYDEDAEVEEEDLRMTLPQLAAGLVRIANQLVQMLGAEAAQEHDAIAGQFRWFVGLVGEALSVTKEQIEAVAALPIRGDDFFSFPAEGWKDTPCRCFLQLSIDGADAGRVVVELDTQKTPKTAYDCLGIVSCRRLSPRCSCLVLTVACNVTAIADQVQLQVLVHG